MGVALLTGSCVAAVVVSERAYSGAHAGAVAHHAAVPAAAYAPAAPDGSDGADNFEDVAVAYPTAEVQVGSPVTIPALPPADDPRLRAVPHMAALGLEAGPHAVNVPIVMYHFLRVVPNPQSDRLGFNLSVTPSDFALQLAFLKREGFTPVSITDVLNAMQTGTALPKRPIVLTFDDGYADFAGVGAPLLMRAGFTGTNYVVSGFVGRPGYMSAEQVRQVVAMGMTVGAHTEHHVDLARVAAGYAQQEIAGSRAALQKLTGQPVTDFAYPSGQFNQQVIGMVQHAGFRSAVTTIPGFRHDAGQPLTMNRVRVAGGESLMAFAQSVSGPVLLPLSADSPVTQTTEPASPMAPAAPGLAITPQPGSHRSLRGDVVRPGGAA